MGANTEGRPARRWLRRLAWIALGLALLAALGLVLITRDPTARILARRGTLGRAEAGPEFAADGYVDQDVRLISTSGLAVELRVRRPDDGGATPRAAMLLLGGHRTGKLASELVPDTHGVVLAALDYPTDRERIASVGDALAARRAILDTPAAILLTHDWLRTQGFVDPERVELVGVSLGAPFACVAGALDERFRRVWSIHGGGSPLRLLEHGLRRKLGWKPARQGIAAVATVLAHGLVLAPEDWVARIAPRPFVMVNGRTDEAIPRDSIDLLYAAAREPKELVWIDGGHIEKRDIAKIRELVAIVLVRME